MKNVMIAAGFGAISFLAGLFGIFMVMPKLAPDVVEQTRRQLDSLGLIAYVPADTTLDAVPGRSDSLGALQDSIRARHVSPSPQAEQAAAALQDSLQLLQRQLRTQQDENRQLLARIEALQNKVTNKEDRHATISDLAGTLTKLEDQQLGAILGDIDMKALEMLFEKASSRDRAKLLQSMPADRAAHFVGTLLGAAPPSPPVVSTDRTGPSAP